MKKKKGSPEGAIQTLLRRRKKGGGREEEKEEVVFHKGNRVSCGASFGLRRPGQTPFSSAGGGFSRAHLLLRLAHIVFAEGKKKKKGKSFSSMGGKILRSKKKDLSFYLSSPFSGGKGKGFI